MEPPTTPKRVRPHLGRSHTAQPSISPPPKDVRVASAAKRAHHLKPLRTHHLHRRHNDEDKATPLSATVGPLKSLHEAVTPGGKASGLSRVTSRAGSALDRQASFNDNRLLKQQSRLVRPEEVARERERAVQRNEDLRASLNNLSDVAQTATRNLDKTWYGILEKATVLRSAIGSMQELSTASKKLHHDFEQDTVELQTEITGQIDAFGGFDNQLKSVEELEQRVKKGMDQANTLSERLESAKKKVEIWEKKEKVWQAKISRRLRVFWSCLGLVILFAVLLLCIPRPLFGSTEPKANGTVDLAGRTSMPAFAVSILEEAMASKTARPVRAEQPVENNVTDDGKLRFLDEL